MEKGMQVNGLLDSILYVLIAIQEGLISLILGGVNRKV